VTGGDGSARVAYSDELRVNGPWSNLGSYQAVFYSDVDGAHHLLCMLLLDYQPWISGIYVIFQKIHEGKAISEEHVISNSFCLDRFIKLGLALGIF
jgi:hypothetical protein